MSVLFRSFSNGFRLVIFKNGKIRYININIIFLFKQNKHHLKRTFTMKIIIIYNNYQLLLLIKNSIQ